jgi:hypothetical protein
MSWFKPKAALLGVCLSTLLTLQGAWAADAVPLGDGSHFLIDEYLIETNTETGEVKLLVRGKPDFQPEQFGPIPADFFARKLEPLCENLVKNSWDQLNAQKIRKTRIRWDFTPANRPDGLSKNVEWSRFHEVDFAIDDNKQCIPVPLSVAQDNLTPQTPSGVGATLRYVEQGDQWGELQLVYALKGSEQLRNLPFLKSAAMELCLIHADSVLAQRFKYYKQFETASVAIQFEQNSNNQVSIERFIFPVVNQKCETGLSDLLKSHILEVASAGSE